MDAVAKPEAMAEESDEDLEALRLAALQSIKNKPTVVAPRRRPKSVGRPNRKRPRNFFRGCVNTNLISIVPLEIPLDQGETSSKSVNPPSLVLPQDRYCKTEIKEETEEKEISVPSKFSRFDDSNSGDSDDDLEFGNQSSEGEKQDETSDKNEKMDDDSIADDDELLLQDEDSIGKFFFDIELDQNEDESERKESSGVSSGRRKLSIPASRTGENVGKGKRSDAAVDVKEPVNDESSARKNSESKSGVLGRRSFEIHESKQIKGDKFVGKLYLRDVSPHNEDSKRINRPCIFGRNRSPSPLAKGKFLDKFQPYSKRIGRKCGVSPKKKPSSPSPESLSPLRKRELHQHKAQIASGKSLQPAQCLPSGSSPREITPPSHWGSRSDSSHGFSHARNTHREWSSSPLKWSGSTPISLVVDSPNKNISPSRQKRRSKSPAHKSSRRWGSSERDWSGSPQHRRSRDFDTPPDSLRSTADGSKAVKRKSTSPTANQKVVERSRQGDRSSEVALSPRCNSPTKHSLHSPSKVARSSSVQSSSRTPSLSPSPEPQGKSSAGNYRRYKSPLRLPGYRPQNHRDGRSFRLDGKPNRKDVDKQHTIRLNGPPRKGSDSKIELPKVRSYNARLESKLGDSSPTKKIEAERAAVQVISPSSTSKPPSSWSSEDGESDSESRFKGSDTKGVKPVIIPSKITLSSVPRVKELEETSPSEKRSPKKKKSKRSKKSFIKVKGKEVVMDESKEKQTNDVDLRAELSRRRAERVNKAKNIGQTMPVRLLQSAFQGLTSKPNPVDGERNNISVFAAKSEVSSDALVSKKKPIHLRLGLPVARNPDPPESRLLANCPLARITGPEKKEIADPSLDGGNKGRKVKLKRNVTVQKSLPRGTSSSVTNTSGKEQV